MLFQLTGQRILSQWTVNVVPVDGSVNVVSVDRSVNDMGGMISDVFNRD